MSVLIVNKVLFIYNILYNNNFIKLPNNKGWKSLDTLKEYPDYYSAYLDFIFNYE